MGRNSIRPKIRAAVGCDACGAAAGERCVAYKQVPGKTVGNPTEDVHMARWRAYMDGRARRAAAAAEL